MKPRQIDQKWILLGVVALLLCSLVILPRLAGSSPAIWKDIAITNADVLRAALDTLIATLGEMRDSLPSGEGVETVFTSACRWRDALDRGR